jgi:hypothetical protein
MAHFRSLTDSCAEEGGRGRRKTDRTRRRRKMIKREEEEKTMQRGKKEEKNSKEKEKKHVKEQIKIRLVSIRTFRSYFTEKKKTLPRKDFCLT